MSTDDKSDKRNLPARRNEAPPVTYDHGNPGGVISSAASGFVSDMRRRALAKRAAETNAHADLFDARTRLATSYETLTRQVGRLYDLDDIKAEDQRVRDEERARNQQDRERATRTRAREAADWDYQDKVAREKSESAFEHARDQALRAKTTREHSEALAPLKIQRGLDLFKAGNYDALYKMRRAEAGFTEAFGDNATPDQPPPAADPEIGLRQAITTIEDQIAKAQARGSDRELTELRAAHSRLIEQVNDLKKQPE